MLCFMVVVVYCPSLGDSSPEDRDKEWRSWEKAWIDARPTGMKVINGGPLSLIKWLSTDHHMLGRLGMKVGGSQTTISQVLMTNDLCCSVGLLVAIRRKGPSATYAWDQNEVEVSLPTSPSKPTLTKLKFLIMSPKPRQK